MKDTIAEISSNNIRCVHNTIDAKRIKIEPKGGKCSLKPNVVVNHEGSSIQLAIDAGEGTSGNPYDILLEDINEMPRNVAVQIALSDMDNLDDIYKVALAQVSELKVWADFPEHKMTFELITPGGHSYGMQSIPLYDERLKQYFDIDES